MGLTAKQKLFGQLLVSAVVCYLLAASGHSTDVFIPFANMMVPLGWFYYVLVAIIMLGTSNAVNFTDGLDGLLAAPALSPSGFRDHRYEPHAA